MIWMIVLPLAYLGEGFFDEGCRDSDLRRWLKVVGMQSPSRRPGQRDLWGGVLPSVAVPMRRWFLIKVIVLPLVDLCADVLIWLSWTRTGALIKGFCD